MLMRSDIASVWADHIGGTVATTHAAFVPVSCQTCPRIAQGTVALNVRA